MVDHLIDEVDDALRRERIETFWRNFGRYIVTASVLIILTTIGVVAWQSHKADKQREWTSALLTAQQHITAADWDKAHDVLSSLTEDASGEIGTLAYIWKAQVEMQQGNEEQARATLGQADLAPGHNAYQDLGLLYEQALGGESVKNETFHYTQQELELVSKGLDNAGADINALLNDPNLPRSMRERLELLKIDETTPVAADETIGQEE